MFARRWMQAAMMAILLVVTGIASTPRSEAAFQPAADSKPPTKAEADGWVKKLNEGLKTGCSVVKASGATATLVALKTKNKQMVAIAAALSAAGIACDETTELIDKIADKSNAKDKEKAAKEAGDKLEELTRQVRMLDAVKARTKEVGAIDLGVVDTSLKQYAVSADDLIKDKAGSIKKLKDLAAALKLNVERLEERQQFLAAVIKGCDDLKPKLESLKKKVEGFKKNDKGVCDTIECLQNLQLAELLKELPKLKEAASARKKDVDKVLEAESARRTGLRSNLKELFDVTVD